MWIIAILCIAVIISDIIDRKEIDKSDEEKESHVSKHIQTVNELQQNERYIKEYSQKITEREYLRNEYEKSSKNLDNWFVDYYAGRLK